MVEVVTHPIAGVRVAGVQGSLRLRELALSEILLIERA